MTSEAQGRHRRSVRLPGYDYSQPGAYFAMIVTAGRKRLSGRVSDGEMLVNAAGDSVRHEWENLTGRFRLLELGAFVIMPNHVHGILIIHERRGTAWDLAELNDQSNRRAPTEGFGRPVPGSIPTIVRSYKSAVSYRVHAEGKRIGSRFWQRNCYEHVIRNQEDWERIHRYIESNPALWAEDEENPAL